MLKGGYKILDLKDVTLSGTATTIEGIYDKVEGSYRKPILISGLSISGVEKNDFYAIPELVDGDFVLKGYGKVITITADDEVTLTDEQGGGSSKKLVNLFLNAFSNFKVWIDKSSSSTQDFTVNTSYQPIFYQEMESEELNIERVTCLTLQCESYIIIQNTAGIDPVEPEVSGGSVEIGDGELTITPSKDNCIVYINGSGR